MHSVCTHGQNKFSICTKYEKVLLQAKEKDLYDWLDALDPSWQGPPSKGVQIKEYSTLTIMALLILVCNLEFMLTVESAIPGLLVYIER